MYSCRHFRYFSIFPSVFTRILMSKIVFWPYKFCVFLSLRKSMSFCVENNNSNEKYRLLRWFWYQSELLTPNGLRERSDESWQLHLYVGQGAMCLHYKGFLIAPWRKYKWSRQLSSDRSRRPFGVRSSDWYQNDRTELYFQLVSLFSVPLKFRFLCFGKTTKLSDKNWTFSVENSRKSDPKSLKYRNISNPPLRRPTRPRGQVLWTRSNRNMQNPSSPAGKKL